MPADAAGIIQLVTGLPPTVDGVGDYALQLAHSLNDRHAIRTRFAVLRRGWSGPDHVEGFEAHRVERQSAERLCDLLSELAGRQEARRVSLLVHLSPYAYQRHGVPLWLLRGLRLFRRRSSDCRVVTMFHELYATGPVWRKAFWLSFPQRFVAAGMLRASDVAVTNMRAYALRLERWSPAQRGAIHVLPVFSTIGEHDAPRPLAERSRRLVVFGQSANRARLYRESWNEIAGLCGQLDIGEIHDIGPPVGEGGPANTQCRLVRHGILPPAEIGALLADSVAGIASYPAGYLAKSTIFAAYCSHAVLPILASEAASSLDGPAEGVHFLRLAAHAAAPVDPDHAQAIASHAHDWYRSHALAVQADAFARILTA